MNIKPTRGKMLGEILPEPEVSKMGIYMARHKEIPHRVKILSVGDPEINHKGKEIKPYAQTGQVVFVKKYSGQTFECNGKKVIFLQNHDIVGKY